MDRSAHQIKRRCLTPPSVPSAAGGGYPPWVILRHSGEHEGEVREEKDLTPDAKTAASSHTSTGFHITVSFSLAAPPATSLMWASAAAGDRSWARPPSLTMLPPSPEKHIVFSDAIGILRRGEDDLVVAELTVEMHATWLKEAKLLVFRSGEWSVKRTPISHGSGSSSIGCILYEPWKTDMVVPVGDRLLCYVDLHHGVIIFSDPPVKIFQDEDDPRGCPNVSRTVGAVTGAGAALKFVDISSRCCCGSVNEYTTCHRSSRAFVIRTWTLRIDHHHHDHDDMAWEIDAMIDATELWSLDAFAGLSFVRPEYPIVSMDDPHIIGVEFTGENQTGGRTYHYRISYRIMVDTWRKTIRSVPPFLQRPRYGTETFLSSFSSYFNPDQIKVATMAAALHRRRPKSVPPLSHRHRSPVAVATFEFEPRTNGIITWYSSDELKISSGAPDEFEGRLAVDDDQ
uniref:DUF1618 domain-containing protein n=1 Tax=Oryza punctata TaxID=4537 RepID=A0A0E0MD02_ORYPU